MRNLMLGILIGSVLTGTIAIAQNEDFYGRPQWGKRIYPKQDAYGRPNPPQEDYLLHKKHRGDC